MTSTWREYRDLLSRELILSIEFEWNPVLASFTDSGFLDMAEGGSVIQKLDQENVKSVSTCFVYPLSVALKTMSPGFPGLGQLCFVFKVQILSHCDNRPPDFHSV